MRIYHLCYMNKKTVNYFIIVLCLLFGSYQASAQHVFIATGGKVSFFSETPVENIDAHTESMTSVLTTTTQDIQFTVPMRTFKFKKALMEEHFNEKYVESELYPKSTFKGKINDTLDWSSDTTLEVSASGEFYLHGVTKSITEKGKISISEGKIHLEVNFNIALKDYNIEIPKIVTKSIAENIRVSLSCDYVPYVKKKQQ